MTEEMQINMITNCARMEAAIELLRDKMLAYDGTGYALLGNRELNEVLSVAGYKPVEMVKEKAPTTAE